MTRKNIKIGTSSTHTLHLLTTTKLNEACDVNTFLNGTEVKVPARTIMGP